MYARESKHMTWKALSDCSDTRSLVSIQDHMLQQSAMSLFEGSTASRHVTSHQAEAAHIFRNIDTSDARLSQPLDPLFTISSILSNRTHITPQQACIWGISP
jgi:hypothetical protein